MSRFVEAAIEHGVPLAAGIQQYEAGALISWGSDDFDTGERASVLADKILRGVSPSELPVVTAKFSLGINLMSAEALGIEFTDSQLSQARGIVR